MTSAGGLPGARVARHNNRNAKYYALTASGRRQLEQHRRRWDRVSFAITSVLEGMTRPRPDACPRDG